MAGNVPITCAKTDHTALKIKKTIAKGACVE
jgi:hypothetical protein